MSVELFHGVPSLVDESDDEEAMERNAFRIGAEEYLPEDLLVDILSKVPLAALARFRSVSKRWKALINYLRFKKSSQIMLIDSRVYLVSINFLGAQDNVVNITSQQLWMDILLSFDFSTERFTSMHIPSSGRMFALSMTREEQKLCMLASVAADDVDVWMANKIDSSGAISWSKFITVKRVYNNHQWMMFLTGMNFLVDEENKVIVCPGKSLDSGRFLHIVGEDKCIQVDKHDDAGSRCSLLLSYAPTLVSASDIL
ncbi:unnamed protein product [Brassica rapa subsp. narinosa]